MPLAVDRLFGACSRSDASDQLKRVNDASVNSAARVNPIKQTRHFGRVYRQATRLRSQPASIIASPNHKLQAGCGAHFSHSLPNPCCAIHPFIHRVGPAAWVCCRATRVVENRPCRACISSCRIHETFRTSACTRIGRLKSIRSLISEHS